MALAHPVCHKLKQVGPKAGHQTVTGLIQRDKHLLHPRLRPVWLHQFTHTATGGQDSATQKDPRTAGSSNPAPAECEQHITVPDENHVLASCSQQSALHLIAYEHPPDKVSGSLKL